MTARKPPSDTMAVENRENMRENGAEEVTETGKAGDPPVAAAVDAPETTTSTTPRSLKLLFLSSDTGGGHRASAESLAKQFQLLFPGSTYDLLDVVEKDGVPPYNSLVSYYKHLSAHPSQWKLVYSVSNSRAFEMLADAHLKLMCEHAVRRSIRSYDPDVVISVHPLMCNVPVLSCSKISQEIGKTLPMFTVVTDLGSAHCLWFANGVERMFVGSEQIKSLALNRGKVPEEKLELAGLPIRHDFAVQSEKLGDRMSPEGKAYQKAIREQLELPVLDRPTILVMGGGEGVGSLSNIVDALYVELVTQGIDALILVVCGRNEKLKQELAEREWDAIMDRWQAAKARSDSSSKLLNMDVCGQPTAMSTTGCIEGDGVTGRIRRMLSHGSLSLKNPLLTIGRDSKDEDDTEKEDAAIESGKSVDEGSEAKSPMSTDSANDWEIAGASPSQDNSAAAEGGIETAMPSPGNVNVQGLGFVTNMAEYMVAADILVSKAGPGTISEAAAVSLPILLTSFLPGQEEGNVEYVVEGGFGAYCNDSDPMAIAEEVCMWLHDDDKLSSLSAAAKLKGAPYAARNIAKAIGDRTIEIMEENEAGESDSPSLRK